jgi:hypothetical protein
VGLITAIFGRDKCARCGVGAFSLDKNHPFTPACALHDYEFDLAHDGTNPKPRTLVDSDLLWRWILIARAASTPEKQCELMMDACEFWPLARKFGGIWWEDDDGKKRFTKLHDDPNS